MIFFLAHCTEDTAGIRKYDIQLVDFMTAKQKHVVRGVWTAELYNQIDMMEFMIVLLSVFPVFKSQGWSPKKRRSL